jgi:hypothetical protein
MDGVFKDCMGALAESLGLDLPEDGGDGSVMLAIDGTEVTLREDAGSGTVVATAGIGEMPPDARGVFAALALRANAVSLGAVALALDPVTDELAATSSLPIALADPEALSRALSSLVDAAVEWRRLAVAFLDADEDAAFSDAEAADAGPLSGNSGFIRV